MNSIFFFLHHKTTVGSDKIGCFLFSKVQGLGQQEIVCIKFEETFDYSYMGNVQLECQIGIYESNLR